PPPSVSGPCRRFPRLARPWVRAPRLPLPRCTPERETAARRRSPQAARHPGVTSRRARRPDAAALNRIVHSACAYVPSTLVSPLISPSSKETVMSAFVKWAGCTVTAMFIATAAHAQVTVENPWVRATVPQQAGTGAFMQLTSQTDATLVQ